jgi:uncharacterized damage-inducible protein DinB
MGLRMPTLKDSMNRMIQQSGARLFQCVSTLTDDEFFREPQLGASAAWTVGHVVNSQDYFVSRIFDRTRKFEEFERVFRGGRSLVAADIATYPSRDHIMTQYRKCHEQTILSLQEFDLNRWDEFIPSINVGDSTYFSRGMMWEFIARHTFYHLGQLSASLPSLSGSATLLYPNLTLE